MAKNNKKKSGTFQEEQSTSMSFYKSTNKNAERDMEKALRGLQSSALKAGAQRIGTPSWSFGAQYGKFNKAQTGGRVTVSQPALIPVQGKPNTYTYGKVESTKLTQMLGRDVAKTSVKAAKSQGGGERMNSKKKKK
jgi:hypothetical protein